MPLGELPEDCHSERSAAEPRNLSRWCAAANMHLPER